MSIRRDEEMSQSTEQREEEISQPAEQRERTNLIVDERNLRLKLLEYTADDLAKMVKQMEQMGHEQGLSKLIIYAKRADVPYLESVGYQLEGVIEGFCRGRDAYMMSRFLTEERGQSKAAQLADEIIALCQSKQSERGEIRPLPAEYQWRQATEQDAEALASLYALVFATYPTPLDQPEYVLQTMREGTIYYLIERDGQLACAASAEISREYGSAELTDCATHPDHLGQGLLQTLFVLLEERLQQSGIYYLYTLTRAQSHGMNLTAAKLGYRYRGRLVNNCTIFSGFEDMNIWVKPLKPTYS